MVFLCILLYYGCENALLFACHNLLNVLYC